MRKAPLARLATVSLLATAALAGYVLPAHAATTANTTTTFTLSAGALAITAPASKDLGTAATGTATLTSQLGAVSVADGRGALLASWTSSVASTDFSTGAATANEKVLKASVDYWSGVATSTTGTGVFTPGQATGQLAVAMSASQTAYSAASVVGNNTATWNPTVIVNIPSAAVAGVYTGTITHSIA